MQIAPRQPEMARVWLFGPIILVSLASGGSCQWSAPTFHASAPSRPCPRTIVKRYTLHGSRIDTAKATWSG